MKISDYQIFEEILENTFRKVCSQVESKINKNGGIDLKNFTEIVGKHINKISGIYDKHLDDVHGYLEIVREERRLEIENKLELMKEK